MTRKWILKEVKCATPECNNTILQVHATGKAKCDECFKEQMNVYRRGIRENVYIDTAGTRKRKQ